MPSRGRAPISVRPDGRARARCARRSTDRGRDRAPPWRRPAGDGIRGRLRASASPECRARCRSTSMRNIAAAPAAADQHAARRRVFDRVRDQILQQPPQQSTVGPHRQRAMDECEIEPLLARQRGEFDLELPHHLVEPERAVFRLHRAGIEPRNVEQARRRSPPPRRARHRYCRPGVPSSPAPWRSTSDVT